MILIVLGRRAPSQPSPALLQPVQQQEEEAKLHAWSPTSQCQNASSSHDVRQGLVHSGWINCEPVAAVPVTPDVNITTGS